MEKFFNLKLLLLSSTFFFIVFGINSAYALDTTISADSGFDWEIVPLNTPPDYTTTNHSTLSVTIPNIRGLNLSKATVTVSYDPTLINLTPMPGDSMPVTLNNGQATINVDVSKYGGSFAVLNEPLGLLIGDYTLRQTGSMEFRILSYEFIDQSGQPINITATNSARLTISDHYEEFDQNGRYIGPGTTEDNPILPILPNTSITNTPTLILGVTIIALGVLAFYLGKLYRNL